MCLRAPWLLVSPLQSLRVTAQVEAPQAACPSVGGRNTPTLLLPACLWSLRTGKACPLMILTGDNMRLLACRFNARSGAPLARLVWTRLITTLAEKPTWESIAPQQMHLAGHSTADLLRNSTVSSGWRSMKWARGCLSPSSRPCRLDRERYWQRDCSCTCLSMLHSLCAHK